MGGFPGRGGGGLLIFGGSGRFGGPCPLPGRVPVPVLVGGGGLGL